MLSTNPSTPADYVKPNPYGEYGQMVLDYDAIELHDSLPPELKAAVMENYRKQIAEWGQS